VETDVNVTKHDSDNVTLDVERDVVESCASRLNTSLQQVQLLDQILADRMSINDNDDAGLMRRPLTVVQATSDCPAARMTPAGFLYLTSGWQCPQHLVLDRHLWQCVSRLYQLTFFLLIKVGTGYPDQQFFAVGCRGMVKVKVKFSHTRYGALSPELIPVYRQSAHR